MCYSLCSHAISAFGSPWNENRGRRVLPRSRSLSLWRVLLCDGGDEAGTRPCIVPVTGCEETNETEPIQAGSKFRRTALTLDGPFCGRRMTTNSAFQFRKQLCLWEQTRILLPCPRGRGPRNRLYTSTIQKKPSQRYAMLLYHVTQKLPPLRAIPPCCLVQSIPPAPCTITA